MASDSRYMGWVHFAPNPRPLLDRLHEDWHALSYDGTQFVVIWQSPCGGEYLSTTPGLSFEHVRVQKPVHLTAKRADPNCGVNFQMEEWGPEVADRLNLPREPFWAYLIGRLDCDTVPRLHVNVDHEKWEEVDDDEASKETVGYINVDLFFPLAELIPTPAEFKDGLWILLHKSSLDFHVVRGEDNEICLPDKTKVYSRALGWSPEVHVLAYLGRTDPEVREDFPDLFSSPSPSSSSMSTEPSPPPSNDAVLTTSWTWSHVDTARHLLWRALENGHLSDRAQDWIYSTHTFYAQMQPYLVHFHLDGVDIHPHDTRHGNFNILEVYRGYRPEFMDAVDVSTLRDDEWACLLVVISVELIQQSLHRLYDPLAFWARRRLLHAERTRLYKTMQWTQEDLFSFVQTMLSDLLCMVLDSIPRDHSPTDPYRPEEWCFLLFFVAVKMRHVEGMMGELCRHVQETWTLSAPTSLSLTDVCREMCPHPLFTTHRVPLEIAYLLHLPQQTDVTGKPAVHLYHWTNALHEEEEVERLRVNSQSSSS